MEISNCRSNCFAFGASKLTLIKAIRACLLVSIFASLLVTGLRIQCCASINSSNSQAALKLLHAYVRRTDNATSVGLSADATVDNEKYQITGVMQKPNMYDFEISQKGMKVARLVCDGKTITEYDLNTNKYITMDAKIENDSYFNIPSLNPLENQFVENNLSQNMLNVVFELKADFLNPKFNRYENAFNNSRLSKGNQSLISLSRIKDENGRFINRILETQKYTANLATGVADIKETWLMDFNGNSGLLTRLTDNYSNTSHTDGSVFANETKYNYDALILSNKGLPASRFQFSPPESAIAYHEIVPLAAGITAPDFTVESVDHKPVKLSDFAGKIVVLDFWATWCGPCQASLPHLDDISKTYVPKGVIFLPICISDTRKKFDDWLSDHKQFTMSFLFDPLGESNKGVGIDSKLYNVTGIPTQFVIGKDGKIVSHFVGYDQSDDPGEKELTNTLDKLLAETN